jgi:hypothetical protein
LLVATPRVFFEQEYEGNPLQSHRSHWPEPELRRAGAVALLHRGESLVALFGNASAAGEYLASSRPRLRTRLLPPAIRDFGHAAVTRWRLRTPKTQGVSEARRCVPVRAHVSGRAIVDLSVDGQQVIRRPVPGK